MKKILTILTTITILFNAFALYAYAEDEKYTVLIIAEDGIFNNTAQARDRLFEVAGCEFELDESYENLFFGFSAAVDISLAKKIHASESFEVHLCGEFEPLEAVDTEYETQIMYAREMINPVKSENGELKYRGKGIKVAVIDDGFDVTHSAFAKAPDKAVFTYENLTEIYNSGELNVQKEDVVPEGMYISAKIPFAYNYAEKNTDVSTLNNHGTHVAGIIGADCDELTGIAPDCQLFLMKTFSEKTGTANEIYVISALEDAIELGADVVNLSIGTYSGFSESGMISVMGRIARSLERAGIAVNCAAGNDGTIGRKSAYYRNYGLNLPLNSIADFGTVNYPAALSGFTAVASAQNKQIADNVIIHSQGTDERRIIYSDTNAELGLIEGTFVNYFDGKTLEYVVVPGLGEKSDYKRIDVYGKIALVERGTVTFAQKVNNAAENGAVGVVVYNNSTTDTDVKMDITGCSIPAVFISLEDGEFLKSVSLKELIFSNEKCGFKENPNAYKPSEYSSWGVTPELTLKPDITAIGQSVYSAAAGGHYTSLSGTSMATPMISGACAIICEMLNLQESKYTLNKRPAYIKNLLMSTAAPLVNPDTETEYSPRVQGAGLVDISGAVDSEILIKDSDRNPSLSLGDNIGDEFTFSAIIENITDKDIEAFVDVSLLCDVALKANGTENGTEEVFNALIQKPIKEAKISVRGTQPNINKNADKPDIYSLTIPANSETEMKITVELNREALPISEFPNGFFIDGFLYVKTEAHTYSMPFTGFYGDFAKSEIFDASAYSDYDKSPFLYGNLLLSMYKNKYSVLGSNDLTINGEKLSKYISFSPNGDKNFDDLYFTPSIFRNINGFEVQIKNMNGEILYIGENNKKITKSNSSPTEYFNIWDGSDNMKFDYVFPDGDYFVTIIAKCYGNSGTDSITLPIKIDTQPPSLVGSEIKTLDGKRLLEVSVSDNVKVRKVDLYKTGESSLSDIDNGDEVFVFDITGLDDGVFWADITDYAMNTKTEKIILG